jgi:outer membrane protein OmpA-like peptidoglycan-associated protein
MESVFGLNPEQYREFSKWHKIIALLLALLLILLWLLGYGPGAFRHCADSHGASSDAQSTAAITFAPPLVMPPESASTAVSPTANAMPEPAKLSEAVPPAESPKLESPTQPEPATAALETPAPAPNADASAKAKLLGAAPGARIYFGVDQATLPKDADRQLAKLIAYLKGNPGERVLISGFHDSSGRISHNIELAKKRALAVADVLEKAGVSASRIELQKPTKTRGSGPPTEARRVELKVMN